MSEFTVPSSARVEAAVRDINEAARDGGWDLQLRIGQIVLETCYGGNFDAWRARGSGDMTLRKLASHENMPLSASVLSRSVGLYDLDLRLGVSARKHITVTHARAVLGLPTKVQNSLLSKAESEELTTKQLEALASEARDNTPTRRGRPPLPQWVKTVRHVEKLLMNPQEALGDIEARELSPDERVAWRERVEGLRARLATVVAELEAAGPIDVVPDLQDDQPASAKSS